MNIVWPTLSQTAERWPISNRVEVWRERGAGGSHHRGVEHLLIFPRIKRVILIPLVLKLDERARGGCSLEKMEGVEDDPGLALGVERPAGLMAERKVYEDGAGRLDERGDIGGRGERDGRNAGLFDGPGEQSHGLVAELSDRDEERGIHIHRA